ncbi:MAG: HdeD family acid-resistance protein [Candidatus Babeliales bacterium]|nr:HdeD family acid-resistance protein [Candidatus Babeliales bacterium]
MNYFNNLTGNEREALNQLKENRGWYLALGIGLVALGILAVLFSIISTELMVIYLGAVLFVFGVFEVVKALKLSHWSNFFLHLFLGILYIVASIFIVIHPLANALSLTLLLAVFFVVAGIARIVFSFTNHVRNRGWLLLNGLVTLLLGILIWVQWPYSGLWVIGTIVGIDAIFTGWTWIILAIEAKNIKIENHHHNSEVK